MVGCPVDDNGAVGKVTVEGAGFWLQATNPTNRITASKLLKCIGSHTSLNARMDRLSKEPGTQGL